MSLPRWYGPHDHPPIPLVISPHGRGGAAVDNVHLWGNPPAIGPATKHAGGLRGG